MSTPRPTPTDAAHEFGDDELFFSTTDAKGVIELANSTFVRLSGYDADELVGAPHNIVRHPSMPGGAFAVLWGELEAGRPACVYVDNLSKDGGRYRVFATAVPLGEGYLSVRMRPRHQPLVDASFALYEKAAIAEAAARQDGASARDAAALGATTITDGLRAAGIENAGALAAAALPAELAEQRARSGGIPTRPDATGSFADALREMHALDAQTAGLHAILDELAGIATELESAWPRVSPALEQLREAAQIASQPVDGIEGEAADDLVYHGQQVAERARSARTFLTAVPPQLEAVLRSVEQARLRMALVRLHTLMAATFAVEAVDGDAVGDPKAALRALATALDDGTSAVEAATKSAADALAAIGDELRWAVSEVDRLRRPLYRWQGVVEQAGRADLAEAIPTQIEGLAELSGLSARCRQQSLDIDVPAMRAHIAAVRAAGDA